MPGTINTMQTIGSGATSFDAGTYIFPTSGTGIGPFSLLPAVYAPASAVPTLTNAGTLKGNGNAYGVILAGVGTIINAGYISSGSAVSPTFRSIYIEGSAAGSSYVSNSGTLDRVRISSPGRVTNAAGGVIHAGLTFSSGHLASLDNAGYVNTVTITGSGTVSNTGTIPVVLINGSGMVTNASQIGSASQFTGLQMNDGTVINEAGAVVSGTGLGVVALNGALSLVNDGTINGGKSGFSAGVYLGAGGSVTNSSDGRIAGGYGIDVNAGTATVVTSGAIVGNTVSGAAIRFAPGVDNLLSVNEGASFTGLVNGGNTLGATSASTLELASGSGSLGGIGELGVAGATVVNFADIEFSPGAAWTIAGSSSVIGLESITGFAGGDAIDVQGGGVAKSVSVSGGTVSLFTSPTPSGAPFFTFSNLTGPGGATLNPASIALIDDGAGGTLVACFAAGTRIATQSGEIEVQDLRAGDRVGTLLRGQAAAIVWVGQRFIDCTRHRRPKTVWPVRIRAGAFGPDQPCRDLLLSPDHALYVLDVLIPVKQLINGSSIAQVPVDAISYYHVELARHDVIMAEGLPAESYLDVGDRANFTNGHRSVALHPDFSTRAWEARGCAPLVVAGPKLDAVRQRLNALASCRTAGKHELRAIRRLNAPSA